MFENPVKTGFSLGSLLGNVGWHNTCCPVVVKGSVCFMMLFVCWAHGHVQWFILFMRQNGSLHWFHVAFVIFMSIWINIPSKRSKVIHDPCHSCHIGPISRLRGTGVATCWVSRGGLPGLGMSLLRITYVKIMYVHPQAFRRRKFSWYLQCFFSVFTVAFSGCLHDKG